MFFKKLHIAAAIALFTSANLSAQHQRTKDNEVGNGGFSAWARLEKVALTELDAVRTYSEPAPCAITCNDRGDLVKSTVIRRSYTPSQSSIVFKNVDAKACQAQAKEKSKGRVRCTHEYNSSLREFKVDKVNYRTLSSNGRNCLNRQAEEVLKLQRQGLVTGAFVSMFQLSEPLSLKRVAATGGFKYGKAPPPASLNRTQSFDGINARYRHELHTPDLNNSSGVACIETDVRNKFHLTISLVSNSDGSCKIATAENIKKLCR